MKSSSAAPLDKVNGEDLHLSAMIATETINTRAKVRPLIEPPGARMFSGWESQSRHGVFWDINLKIHQPACIDRYLLCLFMHLAQHAQ